MTSHTDLLIFLVVITVQLDRIKLEEIDSTNSWARRQSAMLAKDKITFITATCQTAGRGKGLRRWVCLPGNLFGTFHFVPGKAISLIDLTAVLAHSAIKMLQEFGLEPRFKYPNDVFIGPRKISGVLCETVGEAVIIGISLNINFPKAQLAQIDQPATSMLAETGRTWEVEAVTTSLQNHFVTDLAQFLAK